MSREYIVPPQMENTRFLLLFNQAWSIIRLRHKETSVTKNLAWLPPARLGFSVVGRIGK